MCLAGPDPTGCSQRPWLSLKHGRSKCPWLGPCSWQPPGSGLLNASNQTASPEGFLPPQSEIIKVGKEIQHLVKGKARYQGKASLPPQCQVTGFGQHELKALTTRATAITNPVAAPVPASRYPSNHYESSEVDFKS